MTKQPKRILVIGPSWVGDTVMSQGLLRFIKQQNPQVSIDVLAPAWTFPLLARMQEVSQAIEIPITHGELKLLTRFRIAQALRKNKYDQAIVLPNSFKSALIPFLAGIPKRTGWLGEWRYGLLNDARPMDRKRYPLMIEQYMALGLERDQPLPADYPLPAFIVSKDSVNAVLQKHQLDATSKPIIALCAGAEFGPSKRWPEEYYGKIANTMLERGFAVWLFGSGKDKPVVDNVMQLTNNRAENLAGKLALFETIDLLSCVSGVVSNDSGLLHVTAALGKPLIAIYGSTSPDFTPPLAKNATVLKLALECQPCFQRVCPLVHHRCMRDLTPEMVLAHIDRWGI